MTPRPFHEPRDGSVFAGGAAPGFDPTRPDPASATTRAGGATQWDVSIRLRAKNEQAARDRVDRWIRNLTAFASVESVEVDRVDGTGHISDPARALRGHGYPIQEEPMSDAVVVSPGPGRKIHIKHNPADTVAYEARVYEDGERTAVVGYGMTRDRAVENARSAQAVVDGGAEPDEWVEF
jgi:hypothetical protein